MNLVSPDELYESAIKKMGKFPKTKEDNKAMLFLMSYPIHKAIRLSATRLLNRMYNLRVSDDIIKAICEYWDTHTFEEFLEMIGDVVKHPNK